MGSRAFRAFALGVVVLAVAGMWSREGATGAMTGPSTRAASGPATRAVRVTIPETVVAFDLIYVPRGRLQLDDERGGTRGVDVEPFWMGRCEVTWDEADVLLYGLDLARWPKGEAAAEREARVAARSMPSETPYEAPDRGWGHTGWPAGSVHVRWARRYCEWLSKKTGARYRLPTEAEWEWACRAGAPRRVALRGAELDAVAWHGGNSAGKDGEREPRPHRVATRRANAWGFHDLLGNVAEWVRRADGTYAVAGGSFEDAAGDVHAGAREAYSERWQRNDPRDPRDVIFLSDGAHVGFRVVREE